MIGTVCEFNPLHLGHARFLQTLTTTFHEPVITVMSSCFVQRGEPSVFDPYTRTRMALSSGYSLVLSLHPYYSTQSAERFAYGAVKTLALTGLVDTLAFGMEETDKLETLEKAAALLSPETDAYRQRLRQYLSAKMPFASARQKALEDLLGVNLPTQPNAILALEYLKAIRRVERENPGLRLKVTAVQRTGDSEGYQAHTLRQYLHEGQDITPFIPAEARAFLPGRPVTLQDFYPALRARIACETPKTLKGYEEMAEGFENRLLEVAPLSTSYEDLLERLYTKQYPKARVRRILLNVLLGITREKREALSFDEGPAYLRVLGCRKDQPDLLGALSSSSSLPVVASLARDQKTLSQSAASQLEEELRIGRIYQTQSPTFPPHELRQGLILI